MIAGPDLGDAGTNTFDDACAFVPKDDRERSSSMAHCEISVADADGDDTHDDFVVSGVFQIQLFDREDARGIAHDCGVDPH